MRDTLSDESGKALLPEITGYTLLRAIGHGGMSTVYLGEQVSLSRQVAIKVMLPEALADEVSRRRFENEARTIARLEHPHIVGIHDVGRTRDGLPYYSMPHLTRGHLGQRINASAGGRMDQSRVREILHALLSALGYAHARGTIHRDVKAENVLFDETDRPLLADFGIALRRGYGTRVTTTGMAVGSTAYMAPEQARGEEVDHRADLYAIGVLAWEMLTGKLPYDAADAVSMAIMHVKEPIPRLPPSLRHWQRFIDRALAKGPIKRYHDAAHMLSALERVPQRSGTHEMLALPALREQIAKVRTMPVWAWLGVALVAAAGVGLFLRHDGGDTDYFRVAESDVVAMTENEATFALPAPPDADGQPVAGDPAGALLRAAPVSNAERWVTDADEQIRRGRLGAPAGDNARDSLLAAQRSDTGYLGLPAAVDRFVDASADAAVRGIRDKDDKLAAARVRDAMKVAEATQRTGSSAVDKLHARVMQALLARIAASAAAFDQAGAQQVVDNARALGLSRTDLGKLSARANDIPAPGEPLDKLPGDMVLVRNGNSLFAVSQRPVSRDEYARFANATGREPARCRVGASLLRVLSPRDWTSPGFEQSGNDPVVCVSWEDANAYARWLAQRSDHAYRLPHAREAALLPAAKSARQVSAWNNDCSGNCSRRIGSGPSWRGDAGTRPLEAARGYDDVGIRLVSDLPHGVAAR